MVKSPNHRMHHINSWNSSDLPVYRKQKSHPVWMGFCFAASFYFSSTTLYCTYYQHFVRFLLLLLPQRYEFSSKSQLFSRLSSSITVVVATAKVRIFKQITTHCGRSGCESRLLLLPQRYEFSSKSQLHSRGDVNFYVVVATAKVRIFKQITTERTGIAPSARLLLLPQRYEFSSKSQPTVRYMTRIRVVVATAKVRIFKQITT